MVRVFVVPQNKETQELMPANSREVIGCAPVMDVYADILREGGSVFQVPSSTYSYLHSEVSRHIPGDILAFACARSLLFAIVDNQCQPP